ncbi:YfhL family 4Fe-4S dicluster ferredoxin [Alteromonas antoniana]|uniref:YfhL family 4Fe-4S dicluster ferredoxin n=1 Tax=Alteromonas antoniana TaxID=2803813 RepID=UPI001C464BE9|nr:YfhL family 4Fe-4S dicluster ferredoxin [Alteromonas antoniana]
MALTITDECINCDLCVDECPNTAIFAGNDVYEINPDRCTECIGHYDSPSCVGVCPVECIVPDPKRRESLDQLAEKYAALCA